MDEARRKYILTVASEFVALASIVEGFNLEERREFRNNVDSFAEQLDSTKRSIMVLNIQTCNLRAMD